MRYKSGTEKQEQMTIWIWRILVGSIWGAIIVLLFLHRKDFTVDEILKFTPANSLLAALTIFTWRMLLYFT